MEAKLDRKNRTSLLQAVLLISSSQNLTCSNLKYIYRLSIAYLYSILTVLYFENKGTLQGNNLHKLIKFSSVDNEACIFRSTMANQLDLLGIKDKIFRDYQQEIWVKNENYLRFIGILREIITSIDLNPQFFGYLYEYFQQYELYNADDPPKGSPCSIEMYNLKYVLSESSGIKKRQGSYFTPPELIKRLKNSSMDYLLKEVTSLNDLLNLKVLDPACGGGNILLDVFNELYEKAINDLNQSISPDDLKKLILKNCIFGVDIDEFACEVTKLVLFTAGGRFDHLENIVCGNFLIENLDGYEFSADLSGLFSRNSSKFSLVIGNPPYLNIQNMGEVEKKFYVANYKSAYRRFDICTLFFEKALKDMLKPRGIVSFVVPDKVLTQSYAKNLRQYILDNHTIKEIISFNNCSLFAGAMVTPVILSIKHSQSDIADVKTTEIFSSNEKITFTNQEFYKNLYNLNFRLGWNTHKQEIIDLIQAKSFPLYKLCYISWGAQPGDAKKFIFSSINNVSSEYREYLKPLIRGGNIDRYCIVYSGDHLLYLTEGSLKLHRPAFPELFASEKIVVAEVTATKGLIASLDNSGFFTNHSVINCMHKKDLVNVDKAVLSTRGIRISNEPDEKVSKWQENQGAYTRSSIVSPDSRFNNLDIKYALSIINSKLVNFYFRNYLSGDLNVFPELVRYLPIFDISAQIDFKPDIATFNDYFTGNRFEEIERELIMCINNKDYNSLHSYLSLIAERLVKLKGSFNQSEFKTLDNILDKTVYNLYGLSKNQIAFIEGDI